MFRWILPALLSGLVALLVYFPLGWAGKLVVPDEVASIAPDLGFSGTIWNGSISGLPVFGEANLNLSPRSRSVTIKSGAGRNYLSGILRPKLIKDVDLRIDLGRLPLPDERLKGLRGDISAQISEVEFDGQNCRSATGSLRTDVLQRNGGTIEWTGPELTGPIRCEDGAIIADLKGRDAQQSISALIRLSPDGAYRADITARTARQEADAILPLFGFTRSGQSFVLTEQGRWR